MELKLTIYDSKGWRLPAIRALAVCIFAAFVIAARCWPQLVRPDVRVEHGTLVIPSFAHHGWAGLDPVADYLVVSGKLISFVSLTLTFDHYAFVSPMLAIATQAAVVATIAVAYPGEANAGDPRRVARADQI